LSLSTEVMPFADRGLQDLSGSSSTSEGNDEEEPREGPSPPKKPVLSVESLFKQGYRSGPSVLLEVEDKKQENWTWGKGGAHARESARTAADREATSRAANEGTEEAVKAGLQQAERLKRLRKKERIEEKRATKKALERDKKRLKRNEDNEA